MASWKPIHPLEKLDVTSSVAKRAQYEAFEFTLADGGVLVRNGSHLDPSDHEYLVTIEDGLPVACECSADEWYAGACKHRVAVALLRPLLDAVTAAEAAQSVAPDGGQRPLAGDDHDEGSTQEGKMEPEREDCDASIGDFPCWECVRTGRKELPD